MQKKINFKPISSVKSQENTKKRNADSAHREQGEESGETDKHVLNVFLATPRQTKDKAHKSLLINVM